MRKSSLVCILCGLTIMLAHRASSTEVYSNDFANGVSSLNNFVIGNVGSSHSQFSVEVTDGQLRIAPGSPQPSGAYAAINSTNFLPPYSSVLRNNSGLVTWAFNVWNQDGIFNNSFSFAIASSAPDARIVTSTCYVFEGGGMVGNRMLLFRQGGPPGGLVNLVDVPNGLGTFPQVGSFKITFDPKSSLWSLYGVMGTEVTNPANVNTLLGTAVDNELTGVSLPYMSLSARTTGLASFDNVSVTVVPKTTVICSSPLILECTNGSATGSVQAEVTDLDGNAVEVIWTVDGTSYQTNQIPSGGTSTRANVTFTGSFGTGEHGVIVSAWNGRTTPAICSTTVSVVDTTPPQITHVQTTPEQLWPPNGRMVPVRLIVEAADNCDPAPVIKITRVTSNEPQKRSEQDWEFTGAQSLNLRSERLGSGNGRVYTIQIECKDANGNVSFGSVDVTVPHSQRWNSIRF